MNWLKILYGFVMIMVIISGISAIYYMSKNNKIKAAAASSSTAAFIWLSFIIRNNIRINHLYKKLDVEDVALL